MQTPKRQSPVSVEIEELVLEAAGPYQADLLAHAVEQELARLLAGQELPAAVLHARLVEVIDGGELAGHPGPSARAAGAAIAGAIHRGLTGPTDGDAR